MQTTAFLARQSLEIFFTSTHRRYGLVGLSEKKSDTSRCSSTCSSEAMSAGSMTVAVMPIFGNTCSNGFRQKTGDEDLRHWLPRTALHQGGRLNRQGGSPISGLRLRDLQGVTCYLQGNSRALKETATKEKVHKGIQSLVQGRQSGPCGLWPCPSTLESSTFLYGSQ